jgi:hypothetical protein
MVKREHTNADLDAAKRRCERLGRRLVPGSRTVMYQQRSSEAFVICSVPSSIASTAARHRSAEIAPMAPERLSILSATPKPQFQSTCFSSSRFIEPFWLVKASR